MHLFLEDTSKKVWVTQKIAPPKLWQGLFQGAFGLQTLRFCGLRFDGFIFFYVKHCRVMVIRRRDVTDIAWIFAPLEMKCLLTHQLDTATL